MLCNTPKHLNAIIDDLAEYLTIKLRLCAQQEHLACGYSSIICAYVSHTILSYHVAAIVV
jgi:hypothetical protein